MAELMAKEYLCSTNTAEEYIEVLKGIDMFDKEFERLKVKYGY